MRPWLGRAGRAVWRWARVVGGVLLLVLIARRVGGGPFLDGVRAVDGAALAAAVGVGVVTTVCCAWRWSLVAAGLGVRLPLPEAVAAYYRAQFLNTTLPGGVVGDVHRAVRHGRDIGDVKLGFRAVLLERFAGQGVGIGLAVVMLVALPSPALAPVVVTVAAVALVAVAALVTGVLVLRARGMSPRWARVARRVRSDVRHGLLPRRTLLVVVVASSVVLLGNVALFLVAARSAGSTAPLTVLTPVTLLALLAMIVPLNVAGWGPREGVAAWAFGTAGLTAAQGVTAAVTYGLLILVASLPGAAVLVLRWRRREAIGVPDG